MPRIHITRGGGITRAGRIARAGRAGSLLTRLNVHIAVVVVLLLFDLVLATRLIVYWHESHSDQSAQYNADLAAYAQLRTRSARLRALPAELAASNRQAQGFIDARVPDNDSSILTELGALKDANHVSLSQAHYTLASAIPGLLEFRIEASVTGPYSSVMHFINGIERDKNHAFFIIRSITLTNGQANAVNLRMMLTTYMRSDTAVNQPVPNNTRGPGREVQ